MTEDATTPEHPEAVGGNGPSFARFAENHLSLVVALAAGALVVARLSAVSHGSRTTSMAILDSVGTGNTLFAIAADVGPGAIVGLLVGARSAVPGWALFLSLPVLVFIVPWPMALVAVGGLVLLTVLDRRRRSTGEGVSPAWSSTDRDVYSLVVGVGLAAIVVMTPMWLPRQSLMIDGGERIVGYVLEEDEDSVRVLVDESRAVRDIGAISIVSRTLCVSSQRGSRVAAPLGVIFGITGSSPDYPDCGSDEAPENKQETGT